MRWMWVFCLISWAIAVPGNVQADDKIKLGLNWKAEPEFGGFYDAQVRGTYKKQGLQVEIIEGAAATPVVQMVASGKLDFGTVSADEVILSRSRGQDVVAIFATFQMAPYGMMIRDSKGIKSFEQL